MNYFIYALPILVLTSCYESESMHENKRHVNIDVNDSTISFNTDTSKTVKITDPKYRINVRMFEDKSIYISIKRRFQAYENSIQIDNNKSIFTNKSDFGHPYRVVFPRFYPNSHAKSMVKSYNIDSNESWDLVDVREMRKGQYVLEKDKNYSVITAQSQDTIKSAELFSYKYHIFQQPNVSCLISLKLIEQNTLDTLRLFDGFAKDYLRVDKRNIQTGVYNVHSITTHVRPGINSSGDSIYGHFGRKEISSRLVVK